MGFGYRQQPWSAYALHLATFSPPAVLFDGGLVFLCFAATKDWPQDARAWAFGTLVAWIFVSKVVKLLGHFIRYPVDIFLLPVSIAFGYFHGLVKLYAFCTLNVVSYLGSVPSRCVGPKCD